MLSSNKIIFFIFLDALAALFTLYVSFYIRYEFIIPDPLFNVFIQWSPWFVLSQIIVFYLSGLYARLWKYTSLFDLYAILSASATSCGIAFIAVFFTMGSFAYPRSVLLLYFVFNTILVILYRLIVRVYYSHYHKKGARENPLKRLLLIGAGSTGEKIAREIRTSSSASRQFTVVGFVDDDFEKKGALLHGKKVFGTVNDLPKIKVKYDELLITAPSATGNQLRKIIKVCKDTGKNYKTVPSINEIIDGEFTIDRVREVSYSDLLGREEVKLDHISIASILQGKRVLVTGAGGSIGSELVKQCLSFKPAEIICLDFSEEKIYNLEQSISSNRFSTIIKMVLASVNNKTECEKVFVDNRPQIVFHAAAYKHVPIQELHPWSSVKTNIGGTLNIVELSDKYSVDKFVFVSTDKAVNPANIMGATKRASEKLIQSYNNNSKTTMMAVRFGNVLGSSGSAIPTFQRQINNGGPITITHPEMTRYFMSIQEASQLILQCGAIGKNGEIFLLEMGKPIKIVQMAKDLIRLSGYEPEIDIPIVYTGLRPGEKLYEELQLFNERRVKTTHQKIMVLKESEPAINWSIFLEHTKALISAADRLETKKIQALLKQIIPSFKSQVLNANLDKKSDVSYAIKGQA